MTGASIPTCCASARATRALSPVITLSSTPSSPSSARVWATFTFGGSSSARKPSKRHAHLVLGPKGQRIRRDRSRRDAEDTEPPIAHRREVPVDQIALQRDLAPVGAAHPIAGGEHCGERSLGDDGRLAGGTGHHDAEAFADEVVRELVELRDARGRRRPHSAHGLVDWVFESRLKVRVEKREVDDLGGRLTPR